MRSYNTVHKHIIIFMMQHNHLISASLEIKRVVFFFLSIRWQSSHFEDLNYNFLSHIIYHIFFIQNFYEQNILYKNICHQISFIQKYLPTK